jgi:tRNA A-37 threonylcarbamoyl transferase component Bud32
MADLVGKTLGKYRVIERLGRGGMAEVYKAYHAGLDRYVAVKVMHSHLAEEEDFLGRFEREATVVAKLRHSNIVQVFDFDHEGELYYMVMEFIEGPSLKAELKERSRTNRTFTLEDTVRILSALCSAIDYAHSRGMVHRDIKPANIMFTSEGQVVLADFGIAKIVGATRYTATGALSGTPAYMSPEQGQGQRGDERSDIYSLGVILYEMTTGRVPFNADTPYAVIMKHINDPLPMPRSVNPNVPSEVERVILKAMSKNPEDRYQTAEEMAAALRQAIGVSDKSTLAGAPVATISLPPRPAGAAPVTGAPPESLAAPRAARSPAAPAAERRPAAGLPLLPIIIGAGVVLLLVAAALVGGGFIIQKGWTERQTTQTAIAAALTPPNTPIPTPTSQPSLEVIAGAEVHNGPGAEYPVLGMLKAGDTALVTGQSPDSAWWQIIFPPNTGGLGWVAAVNVQANQQAGDVPIVAGPLLTPTNTPLPPTDTPLPPTNTPEPTTTSPPAATGTPIVIVVTSAAPPTATPPAAITGLPATVPSIAPPTVQAPTLTGKLAYALGNTKGDHDVYIVKLDGSLIGKIEHARQPNFNSEGKAILVNGDVFGGRDNVWMYDGTGGGGNAASAAPEDAFPYFSPYGEAFVYQNDKIVQDPVGARLFVQYGFKPPDDIGKVAYEQVLKGPGGIGKIVHSGPMYPVWSGDFIAFQGCDTWNPRGGGANCGMWRVVSWANVDGSTPERITDATSDFPQDVHGSTIAFCSKRAGNWDVYVIDVTGGTPFNLTNDPAEDCWPAFSPSGSSIAFLSNRGGSWGIWLTDLNGSPARQLFNPVVDQYASVSADWLEERMSWAP